MPTVEAPQPERVETDSSLQAERDKTDAELVKRASAIERDADAVVELARERADGLVEAARDQADETLALADAPASEHRELSAARASEDGEVAAERAAADQRRERERAAQQQSLVLLLELERDETDVRLLVERERSDRSVASRDDFLAMVSHDVRGILSAMTLSADVLVAMAPGDVATARTQRDGQRLLRLIDRMNRLIGDLLDVVSMESGHVKVVAVPQDAAGLVSETLETFQHAAGARTIALTADVVRGATVASFDHDRILQVLTNLVGNAIKFTEPGGTIAVRLAATDGLLQFTVGDSGCGIAAGDLDTIFERFSQASQTDRRGLGLGLYISRSIVEAHGGTIWCESAPGQGSTFHFTLPA